MKIGRCPICHSDFHLDAILEDDASRQLIAKIAELSHGCARHLVNYIGLFRREKNNLSNSRALKLVEEVLELYQANRVLAHALSETVERIREKRAQGDVLSHCLITITSKRFIARHNSYLHKVAM